MSQETVTARYQTKDENNAAVLDSDGKAIWQEAEVTYDFGDDLDQAVANCGAEAVFSNYKANATVALQGILRAKLKAGHSNEQIQSLVSAWKPGTVLAKTAVDPEQAVKSAFASWSPEKKAAFLATLGVQA